MTLAEIQAALDQEGSGVLLPFSQTRQDGWPLCPVCGEDELFTMMPLEFQPTSLGNTTVLERIVHGHWGCYACEWSWHLPNSLKRKPKFT